MRALSFTRPWTELVLSGVKPVENRRWKRAYSGPLIVHGAMSYDGAAEVLVGELGRDGMLTSEDYGRLDDAALHREAPTGYLGVVTVVDIHQAGDLACTSEYDDECCSPWAFPDQWHWQLTDPRRFPHPIPGPGRLGLFDPPEHVVNAAIAALRGAG